MTGSEEYFWGVELSKDKPAYTWTVEEEEEDDQDFLIHTLFLRNAVLGVSAIRGERNVVQIETKNFDKCEVVQPLLSLTLGKMDMCTLDLSFGNEVAVTFRLIEGCGPIVLCGQQLVEFPPANELSQDESDESVDEEDTPKRAISKKRKAGGLVEDTKTKKGKMEENLSSDEESEDEEEEMDDEASSPEKSEKKNKLKTLKGKKSPKTRKATPKKESKPTGKKIKK